MLGIVLNDSSFEMIESGGGGEVFSCGDAIGVPAFQGQGRRFLAGERLMRNVSKGIQAAFKDTIGGNYGGAVDINAVHLPELDGSMAHNDVFVLYGGVGQIIGQVNDGLPDWKCAVGRGENCQVSNVPSIPGTDYRDLFSPMSGVAPDRKLPDWHGCESALSASGESTL